MNTQRSYLGKDVDMLTTCAIIIENAILNQEFLVSKRQRWAEPFFPNCQIRINRAFSNYLGIDSASSLRKSTQVVTEIQGRALECLSQSKIQIQEDFKSDRSRKNEIIRTLGYTYYYKQAVAKDQESLVQLLYRFKTNLTDSLRNEIIGQGTDSDILDCVCACADKMVSANITQETLKGTRKTITEEAVTEFSAIYEEVISIAKIARNFYKGNQNKQDEFSYSKILKKLNVPSRSTNEEQSEQ